jgi:hypothetical protein
MSAYNYLMKEAKLEGKLGAYTEKEQDFTTSLIISTDFDDTKIALLVGVSEYYVAKLRTKL